MSVDSVGWVCLLLQDSLSNILVNTNRHTLPCQHGVDFYSCSHTFPFFLLPFLSSPFAQHQILICVCFFPCYMMLSSFRCLLTYNWKYFFAVCCCSPVITLCVSINFLRKQLQTGTTTEQGKKGQRQKDKAQKEMLPSLHYFFPPLPLDFLRSSATLSQSIHTYVLTPVLHSQNTHTSITQIVQSLGLLNSKSPLQ